VSAAYPPQRNSVRFSKTVVVFHQSAAKIPQGFGLRQPSAALPPQDWRCKSGRGLPQSKTLPRYPNNPIQLDSYSIFETALAGVPRP
jgi:hypothetical protein